MPGRFTACPGIDFAPSFSPGVVYKFTKLSIHVVSIRNYEFGPVLKVS